MHDADRAGAVHVVALHDAVDGDGMSAWCQRWVHRHFS